MTPTRDALNGLVGALDKIDRGEPWRDDDSGRMIYDPQAAARAALSAWERRAPLWDDAKLLNAVMDVLATHPGEHPAMQILDAIEFHLLGTPGT